MGGGAVGGGGEMRMKHGQVPAFPLNNELVRRNASLREGMATCADLGLLEVPELEQPE